MKKNRTLCYILLLGILFFLSSCNPNNRINIENHCIPPITDFAYYAGSGDYEGMRDPYPDNPVLPPEPWKPVTEIDLTLPLLLGIRSYPNNDYEAWFFEAGLSGLTRTNNNSIYIQKKDANDPIPVVLHELFRPADRPIMFIRPDNSVWFSYDGLSRVNNIILGKYNDSTKEILPVTKLNSIDHNPIAFTVVIMDYLSGDFWFIVPNGYIYSYDPDSDILTKHIHIGQKSPAGAVIGPNGNIYIYAYSHEYSSDGAPQAIFEYSSDNETIEQILFPLDYSGYFPNLFIDQSGRLWVSSSGWREPGGEWYQMLRSPLFYDSRGYINDWGVSENWWPPKVEFESPKNLIWFTGILGTYSLDFTEGKWCWVSTSSQLFQDSTGKLWLFAEDILFTYSQK